MKTLKEITEHNYTTYFGGMLFEHNTNEVEVFIDELEIDL